MLNLNLQSLILMIPYLGFFLCCSTALGQIGSIDAPAFEDVVSGQWTFRGWAMDSTAPIARVEIVVDGTDFGQSQYGSNRQDACSAVGNYPGCPNVGWSVQLNTQTLVDGPHFLSVVVSASNGQQSTMVQPFIVDNANRGLTGNTYYQIVSPTGSVVDVSNYGLTAGTNLQEWQYLGGPNQMWKVVPTDDGHWTFESLNSSKVLTLPWQSSNGTVVEQYEDYGSPYQEWSLVSAGNGNYAFLNAATGQALDLTQGNSANGTPIQVYSYLGNWNQLWALVPVTALPSGLFGSGGSSGYNTPPLRSVRAIRCCSQTKPRAWHHHPSPRPRMVQCALTQLS